MARDLAGRNIASLQSAIRGFGQAGDTFGRINDRKAAQEEARKDRLHALLQQGIGIGGNILGQHLKQQAQFGHDIGMADKGLEADKELFDLRAELERELQEARGEIELEVARMRTALGGDDEASQMRADAALQFLDETIIKPYRNNPELKFFKNIITEGGTEIPVPDSDQYYLDNPDATIQDARADWIRRFRAATQGEFDEAWEIAKAQYDLPELIGGKSTKDLFTNILFGRVVEGIIKTDLEALGGGAPPPARARPPSPEAPPEATLAGPGRGPAVPPEVFFPGLRAEGEPGVQEALAADAEGEGVVPLERRAVNLATRVRDALQGQIGTDAEVEGMQATLSHVEFLLRELQAPGRTKRRRRMEIEDEMQTLLANLSRGTY